MKKIVLFTILAIGFFTYTKAQFYPYSGSVNYTTNNVAIGANNANSSQALRVTPSSSQDGIQVTTSGYGKYGLKITGSGYGQSGVYADVFYGNAIYGRVSSGGYAIYGSASGSGYAGFFNGDVSINGNGNDLLVTGGTIQGRRAYSSSGMFAIRANQSSDDGGSIEMHGDNSTSRPGELTLIASAAEKSNGGLIRFLRHHSSQSWVESMRIDKNGKVGIGTTSLYESGYRLYVKEGIKTGKVKTDASLADYVFEDDYEVMPLEDVEVFVEENHHLPGVISQAEVDAQGGVELTSFTIQLQEKLEELYIHVMEMNHELADLKSENEALKAELEELKEEDK